MLQIEGEGINVAESHQIIMDEACFVSEVRFGCVRIDGADQLPVSMVNVTSAPGCQGLALDGATGEPGIFDSFVSILTYQFPDGMAEFERTVEWFGRDRTSRAKLPDGVKFDETVLAVRDAPAGWEHEAYPQSNRKFVHIYRDAKQAVLIRFIARTGLILDHPLFKPLLDGLRIVPGEWTTEPPRIQRKTGDQQSEITATPLPEDVRIELDESAARARDALQLGRVRKPVKIAQAIHEAIDDIRKRKAKKKEKEQFAIDCGALFGQALCEAVGWEWRRLEHENGDGAFAVCSPNGSHAVLPLQCVYDLVMHPRTENNALLLFNMIASGNTPMSTENAYSILQ